jgi:hypothetical protein
MAWRGNASMPISFDTPIFESTVFERALFETFRDASPVALMINQPAFRRIGPGKPGAEQIDFTKRTSPLKPR